MASLYDDLEVTKGGGASKWASPAPSSFSMLQSHVAARKQTTQARSAATRTAKAAPPTLAPVLDLGRSAASAPPTSVEGEYRFNQQTGRLEKVANSTASPFIGDPTLCLGVTDEYNPLYPNDYEDVSKRLKEEKRAKSRSAAPAAGEEPRQLVPRRYDSDSEEDEEEDERRKEERKRRAAGGGGGGAAIAPPPSLVEDSGPAAPAGPPMGPPKEPKDPAASSAASLYGINSVAAKMMAKMGYREGQGLGREGQGMATALTVEKTSRRGGKIIHEKDERASCVPRAEVGNIDALLRRPSKVVLLRNMVGPGEVDDDLQPETAEECGRYGAVANVMIYELPEATEDEAVRIFVEFESVEAATRAIVDLNGRFFGGRIVKATFYDLDRFINLELADEVAE